MDSYYTLLNQTSGGIPLQYHSNGNNNYLPQNDFHSTHTHLQHKHKIQLWGLQV